MITTNKQLQTRTPIEQPDTSASRGGTWLPKRKKGILGKDCSKKCKGGGGTIKKTKNLEIRKTKRTFKEPETSPVSSRSMT